MSQADVETHRHGARLDAADKSWHLSSPTPYDPPLTYGGWLQSRALGLRIASLLNARQQDVDNSASPTDSPRPDSDSLSASRQHDDAAHTKPKSPTTKHRIFIHTSPFQRCVQTSVGIGAGLTQYKGYTKNPRKGSDTRIKTVNQLHSSSPRLHAVDSPRLEPIQEPSTTTTNVEDQSQPPHQIQSRLEIATLRVDAFLGEWLSPDYFEMITHPPNSIMMVAGAKANLVRKSESIERYTPTPPKATGMWGTPPPSANNINNTGSKTTVGKRDRANSSGSVNSSSSSKTGNARASSFRLHPDSHAKLDKAGYDPPTPTYAVSPLDPIPRGYVAHAKDACVNVDYQWDSMRPPQCWGDGGSYGEEWSAMHKRFRRGLNSMLSWYSAQEPVYMGNGSPQDDDDADAEDVLILVTHGAGCNALIGALTNQPVLIDVGMASLTMAVRKEGAQLPDSSSEIASPVTETPDAPVRTRSTGRRGSVDLGLGQVYDLKLVASSEHLRSGVNPAELHLPQSGSGGSAQKIPEYRRRYGSQAHAAAGAPVESTWNLGEPRAASTIGPSGMRRGSIAASRTEKMRTYNLAAATQVQAALEEMKIEPTRSPSGLWMPSPDKPPSPGHDFVLDFSNSPNNSQPSSRPSSRPVSGPNSRQPSTTRPTSNDQSASEDISPHHTPAAPLTPAEDKAAAREEAEVKEESASAIGDLPVVGSALPQDLGRRLSQKGLWGSAPSGFVPRERGTPKRRWTLLQSRD